MPETTQQANLRQSLIARGFIVLEGREQDFVDLESLLFSAHNPQGSLQLLIFKRILEATWNLQRCREAEIALWKSTNNSTLDPLLDDPNQHRYARIAKYARQNQINLRRATEDLRLIQRRDREAQKDLAKPRAENQTPVATVEDSATPKCPTPSSNTPSSPRQPSPAVSSTPSRAAELSSPSRPCSAS